MSAAAQPMTPVDALIVAEVLRLMCEPNAADHMRRLLVPGIGDKTRESLERVRVHLKEQGWVL